mgnify:CR=1 FL=1
MNSSVTIEDSWKEALREEFAKDYFKELSEFVKSIYSYKTCYPSGKKIFSAFDSCPLNKVKVVILGQTHIMAQDKQMVSVFQLMPVQPYLLLYRMFTKNFVLI